MAADQVTVSAEAARAFCQEVFERAHLPKADAFLVADALVDADLRGVSTHGLVRFPIYVTRLRKRLVNPTPRLRAVVEKGATVVLDGDDGFGQVVGAEGMRRAVALARDHGLGMCAIRNSNHLGALAYVAAMAVPHQMIGIVLTITNSVIAPWGGTLPKLGNNPLAIAVPAGHAPPIILDMACSQVARGNLILASKLGRPIPPNWALDQKGKPTEDPDAGLRGSLMPVGGHKGSGLALLVGILGGLLASSPFGTGLGDIFDMTRPQRFGHLILAIDIGACRPVPEFVQAVEAMVHDLKATPCAEGVEEIYMPGELEARRRDERLRHGFPLSQVVLDEVKAVGAELGVRWPD
ncbi:MAG TPA: Ldh family oxidoreductase [Candidatus Methylomirabilis sp.]|nr:Ldh family oxidoreductase [Candidatus Methylomirabilis sp.]